MHAQTSHIQGGEGTGGGHTGGPTGMMSTTDKEDGQQGRAVDLLPGQATVIGQGTMHGMGCHRGTGREWAGRLRQRWHRRTDVDAWTVLEQAAGVACLSPVEGDLAKVTAVLRLGLRVATASRRGPLVGCLASGTSHSGPEYAPETARWARHAPRRLHQPLQCMGACCQR